MIAVSFDDEMTLVDWLNPFAFRIAPAAKLPPVTVIVNDGESSMTVSGSIETMTGVTADAANVASRERAKTAIRPDLMWQIITAKIGIAFQWRIGALACPSGRGRRIRGQARGAYPPLFQRSTGFRAARASSRRRTGVVCGALRTSSGRSSLSRAMAIIASQNASSSSFGSLSVGSIINAPETMSGRKVSRRKSTFRRLDHQRSGDDERKVDRRRM